MTRLLVVRHGESTWNAEGRWQGQADPPLSLRGRRQAAAAAVLLADAGVAVVVSSDLLRARDTAQILAAELAVPLAPAEGALRERRAGPWQGLTRNQIERGWPGFLTEGRRPQGYEDDTSVAARAQPALLALARGSYSVVLVVTHGGLLRAVERDHGIEGSRIPNLGGRWWEVSAERGVPRLVAGEAVALLPVTADPRSP